MKTLYVIYLSLVEDGNVIFSSPFSTFNSAKDNIEIFLNDYGQKIGKKCVSVSKEELEKLKVDKMLEDCFYVRRKNSEATIYYRNVLAGYFRNTFLLNRYGKIGINEFSIPSTVNHSFTSLIEHRQEEVKKEAVEKMSHGVHVTFISELKNVLLNRKNNIAEEIEKKPITVNPFVSSLIEGKSRLRNITPPPERKLIL
jgi:hypothetical protein